MNNHSEIDKIKGMSVEDATEYLHTLSYSTRIVSRDGERFMLTMDYREDRVGLIVVDNLVVSWGIG